MVEFLKKIFSENKVYINNEITLKERFVISNERAYDGVGTAFFDIYNNEGYRVGTIDLRLKMNDFMFYYGHVGYDVYKDYRGHHYAYKACKLLFKIAKEDYKISELIITCSPSNIASYKTLIKLNGECKGIYKVPSDHPLYKHGQREKYIFCYKI